MPKSRAEIQRDYRRRKIQGSDGKEYRENERKRQKQNYIPIEQRTQIEQDYRRSQVLKAVKKFRRAKKKPNGTTTQNHTTTQTRSLSTGYVTYQGRNIPTVYSTPISIAREAREMMNLVVSVLPSVRAKVTGQGQISGKQLSILGARLCRVQQRASLPV